MRSLLRHLRFLAAVQLLPALESGEETTLVGGQAVLEGVMMRSPHAWGICVRKPDGALATHSEPLERMSEKHKWMAGPASRHHDAGTGDDPGLPRVALFGQRGHRSVAGRRREEDRNQRLGDWRQPRALARDSSSSCTSFAAAGRHQAEEPLSRVRQPDSCSTWSMAAFASGCSCCLSGASR